MEICTEDKIPPRNGYLLLEVILAMGMAAALLTGIFAIATGSLSLADKIVEQGRLETRREAFLNFLERSFEQLPGNAELELTTLETSQRYLPTLIIQNAPAAFSFAGLPISAQSIVLTAKRVPSGGVNVILEYYEESLLDNNGAFERAQQEPVGSIILYRDIWRFEIRALDTRTMEFHNEWLTRRNLPLQLELNVVFDPEGEEVVHYLWIPPKVSPANLTQGNRDSRNNRRNNNRNNSEGVAPPDGTGIQVNPNIPNIPTNSNSSGVPIP